MTSSATDRKIRRRALVTGGAIRVGRAIALALAEAGFDVAIAFHRSATAPPHGRRAASPGRQRHRDPGDRSDSRAAARLVTQAARALRGLDVW